MPTKFNALSLRRVYARRLEGILQCRPSSRKRESVMLVIVWAEQRGPQTKTNHSYQHKDGQLRNVEKKNNVWRQHGLGYRDSYGPIARQTIGLFEKKIRKRSSPKRVGIKNVLPKERLPSGHNVLVSRKELCPCGAFYGLLKPNVPNGVRLAHTCTCSSFIVHFRYRNNRGYL